MHTCEWTYWFIACLCKKPCEPTWKVVYAGAEERYGKGHVLYRQSKNAFKGDEGAAAIYNICF